MKLYIYARSAHNFGLENIRRASAVYNMLKGSEPIFCSADYRAATFAKTYLGVDKGVGVDVIGNMPNVMERGDILIYDDSGEASDTMQSHMKEYCTHLYKIGTDIPYDVVDDIFFQECQKKEQKVIFFADDDYKEWFFNELKSIEKIDMPLIWGHYFFFKNEDETAKHFQELLEEDQYIDTVRSSKYILTASVHTALESLASSNHPVLFKRGDKETSNLDLAQKYNIPIIQKDNLKEILVEFETIINSYPKTEKIEKFDITKIKTEVEDTLKKFEMIMPSLEYKDY